MNLPRYARVLLAIGSGVALGLAFPNYNLYLLAWIAMGMLVLACCGAPLKEAPLYGFLHGQVFYPVCLPWVDTVMRQYGNIDPWIAGAFVGLIGFVGGLICMAFSTGRGAGVEEKQIAGLRAGAVSVDRAGIFPHEYSDHWLVVGFVGLSGRAQHGAAADHVGDRNLRIVFSDCGVRFAAGLRGAGRHAARVED